jgi:hypothetical protein
MQEVFEGLVKDSMDTYDDAVSHTDVVELLKYLKVQQIKATEHWITLDCILQECRIAGKPEDEKIVREVLDFARYIEIYDYVIDLIESGRFAKG